MGMYSCPCPSERRHGHEYMPMPPSREVRLAERAELEHFDQVEEVAEDGVEEEQEDADQDHEEDDDLGRADQLGAGGPVDLLHLTVGGDQEVDDGRLVDNAPDDDREDDEEADDHA